MKKIKLYLLDTYQEFFFKVSWTPIKALQSSTIVVVIGLILFSLIIYALDLSLGNSVNFVYQV